MNHRTVRLRQHAAILAVTLIGVGALASGSPATAADPSPPVARSSAMPVVAYEPDRCQMAVARAQAATRGVYPPLPEGWRLRLVCGPAEWGGITSASQRTIELYVEGWLPLPASATRWALLHELGHVYAIRLDDVERAAWLDLRGLETAEWRVSDVDGSRTREQWARSAVEDWADAFAACQRPDLGARWWQAGLAGPPTSTQCRALARFVGVALPPVGVATLSL